RRAVKARQLPVVVQFSNPWRKANCSLAQRSASQYQRNRHSTATTSPPRNGAMACKKAYPVAGFGLRRDRDCARRVTRRHPFFLLFLQTILNRSRRLHVVARRWRRVAGEPDHEQVADALVEEDFGRHPRVGAADDDGEGVCPSAAPQRL